MLLHKFSGVAAIMFPVGELKNGGTCEFSSKICLQECAAFKFATDETIIGYEPKLLTYKFITEKPILEIVSTILNEMIKIDTNILYWFGSGDCEKINTLKITNIIKHLQVEKIVQCGFTRNKKLWKNVKNIDNVYLYLTIEKRGVRKGIGRYVIPNYGSGTIDIFYRKRFLGSCGGNSFKDRDIKTLATCNNCYANNKGCFTDLEI